MEPKVAHEASKMRFPTLAATLVAKSAKTIVFIKVWSTQEQSVLIRNGKRDYVLESIIDFVQARDLKISHKLSSPSRCNVACKRH